MFDFIRDYGWLIVAHLAYLIVAVIVHMTITLRMQIGLEFGAFTDKSFKVAVLCLVLLLLAGYIALIYYLHF